MSWPLLVLLCAHRLLLGIWWVNFTDREGNADDYIQRPGREFKKTDGLKTFLDYVAKYSSPEHYLVTELRKVGKDFMQYFLL